jgi:hypothetical protein
MMQRTGAAPALLPACRVPARGIPGNATYSGYSDILSTPPDTSMPGAAVITFSSHIELLPMEACYPAGALSGRRTPGGPASRGCPMGASTASPRLSICVRLGRMETG